MHLSKVAFFLIGLVVGAVLAETESECGGGGDTSTITITETVSAVTVTVNIATGSGPSSVDAVIPIETSSDITATLTSYSTFTNVLSVIEATPLPVKSTQGPYSFAEHSGTTSWLGGKTPPSTKSFITKTSAITVLPVPESSAVHSGATLDSSSFSTLTLTSTTSKVFTETITESLSTSEPSARPFTGLAPYGWNSTLTTFITVKASVTSNNVVPPTGEAYSTGKIHSPRWDVPPPLQGINPLFPIPVTPDLSAVLASVLAESSYIAPRQVGSIVVATIEGQVVSWTNDYDGGVTATATSESVPTSSVPPTTSLAEYPWDFAVTPAPVTSTSAAAPTTVLGIYPWDLPAEPESSTSLTFSNGEIQPGIPTLQPSLISLTISISKIQSGVPTLQPSSTSFTFPGGEVQPGIPTVQPSINASYMNSLLRISSRLRSVTVTPTSTPESVTSTTSSVFSLISLIPGPTGPFNASATSTTATAPHPSCSDKSPFTIGFDDLPHFSIGNNPNDTDIPPIFNPYRKLYWEGHFGYVPPPTDPFPPVSGEQLAVYRLDDSINVDGSPDAGLELIGEFGSGPRASDSAYWVDAYSVYLGCNNAGPSECVISINGYDSASSTRVASQTVNQPPCPGLTNCKLALVSFNEEFRNLSGIQIIAAVDRRPVTWYMDELELGWSNNTCEATTERNNNR